MSGTIHFLGLPFDGGASRRGAALAPQAFRSLQGLETLRGCGYTVEDLGDIDPPSTQVLGDFEKDRIHHMPGAVDMISRSLSACQTLFEKKGFPLMMGGDHSLAIASIGAAALSAKRQGRPLAVLWFDAHTDFNTPASSPSGNLHGMPVQILSGNGPRVFLDLLAAYDVVPERSFYQIGIRSVDDEEEKLVARSELHVERMKDLRSQDPTTFMQRILASLPQDGHIHVSFDVDALDPTIAPGVGTREPHGISRQAINSMFATLASSGRVGSMDIYELNPLLDHEGKTTQLVVDLLHHFFTHASQGSAS